MKYERTNQRDLTFSRWHRNWTGIHIGIEEAKRLDLVDVDWIEYCGAGEKLRATCCWQPLALYEVTGDWDRADKVAIVTRNLARLAGLPMAIVWYRRTGFEDQIAAFRIRILEPQERPDVLLGPNQMAQWLLAIHDAHTRSCGGSYAQMGVGRIRSFPPFPQQPAVAS